MTVEETNINAAARTGQLERRNCCEELNIRRKPDERISN